MICADCEREIETGMQEHSPDTCIQNLKNQVESLIAVNSLTNNEYRRLDAKYKDLRAQMEIHTTELKNQISAREESERKLNQANHIAKTALDDVLRLYKERDEAREIVEKYRHTDQLKDERIQGLQEIVSKLKGQVAVMCGVLEEIKNNSRLWKAGRAGGQDKYAGLPPMIRVIDDALQSAPDRVTGLVELAEMLTNDKFYGKEARDALVKWKGEKVSD